MIGTGKDGIVSAKSMTSLMMLGAAQGSRLKLRAEGPDEGSIESSAAVIRRKVRRRMISPTSTRR